MSVRWDKIQQNLGTTATYLILLKRLQLKHFNVERIKFFVRSGDKVNATLRYCFNNSGLHSRKYFYTEMLTKYHTPGRNKMASSKITRAAEIGNLVYGWISN